MAKVFSFEASLVVPIPPAFFTFSTPYCYTRLLEFAPPQKIFASLKINRHDPCGQFQCPRRLKRAQQQEESFFLLARDANRYDVCLEHGRVI